MLFMHNCTCLVMDDQTLKKVGEDNIFVRWVEKEHVCTCFNTRFRCVNSLKFDEIRYNKMFISGS